ncbi:MAG: FkbM family methyltransferase [Pirellulales bacterium]
MAQISYAQNREDVLLARLFAAGHRGFYIDVGANDPLHDSVTRYFYERGWCGINVEPGRIFEKIPAARPRDVNLNVALSDEAGTAMLYEFPNFPGSSTFCPREAEVHRRERGFECRQRAVEVTTLADVCRQHASGPIDFISIDVEGHERQVLSGGDWRRWRPVAVVVEATRPNTTIATHGEWEHLLLAAGYLYAAFDGINRYYIRAEDRHLVERLAAPANVLDDFVSYQVERSERLLAETRRQLGELDQAANDLKARLQSLEELGPVCLGVARGLHRVVLRFPRVAAGLKRLARRAA